MRLIVVFLETPGLSRVFGVASWGRMSKGEDVGGTLWGRMSEGGKPRDGRSGIFPERGVGRAKYVRGLVYVQALRAF